MSSVAVYPFEEIASDVFPRDIAGNLNDLNGDVGATPDLELPATVVSFTGRGRSFGDDKGAVGLESVANSLRLRRNVTVRAFLKYRIDNHADTDIGTLCVRGKSGSAAERVLFGVEFERVDAATLTVRAKWEEIGGAAATVTGFSFEVLDPNEFFQIAVSRQWVSTSEALVTYVVNETLLGTETVTDADIGEGTGGTFIIGAAGDGADYQNFLPDETIIDTLAVEDDAMTFEEVRSEFRRITVHQPNGYRILRAYIPPGDAWSKDPDSRLQRWIAAEGDGIGAVQALAERAREDTYPTRAYGKALERWESLLGISPGPSDSVQTRRDRVTTFLRTVVGTNIPDIKSALEPSFGLASSDIEIIENNGLREDEFDTDDISTPPSSMWVTHQGEGTVSIAGGDLNIALAATTDSSIDTVGNSAPYRKASIGDTKLPDTGIGEGSAGSVFIVHQVVNTLPTVVDDFVGVWWQTANHDAFVIGVTARAGAGTEDGLAWFEVIDGVVSARNQLEDDVDLEDIFLLTKYVGSGKFGYEYDGTAEANLTGTVTEITSNLPDDPAWCGPIVCTRGGAGSQTTTALDVDYAFARLFAPQNERGFNWLAYRNPALGGQYDLKLAQQAIDKIKPAHTAGFALDDKRGMLLGEDGLGVSPLYPHGA